MAVIGKIDIENLKEALKKQKELGDETKRLDNAFVNLGKRLGKAFDAFSGFVPSARSLAEHLKVAEEAGEGLKEETQDLHKLFKDEEKIKKVIAKLEKAKEIIDKKSIGYAKLHNELLNKDYKISKSGLKILEIEEKLHEKIIGYNKQYEQGLISRGSLQKVIVNLYENERLKIEKIGDLQEGLEKASKNIGGFWKQNAKSFAQSIPLIEKIKNTFGKIKAGGIGGAIGSVAALGIGFAIDSTKFFIEETKKGALESKALADLVGDMYESWSRDTITAWQGIRAQFGGLSKDGIKTINNLRWEVFKFGITADEVAQALQATVSQFGEFPIGRKNMNEMGKSSLFFARGIGMGAEEAAKLITTLTKGFGMNIKQTNQWGIYLRKSAQKANIPIALMAKDMSENIEHFQHFGDIAPRSMIMASTYAKQFGVQLSNIVKSAKGFDTFGTAAEKVAKMNAVFGSSADVMEMMMETDPVKRMEKMRQSLLSQGRSWETMSYYEQNFLANQLELSKIDAQRLMASNNVKKTYDEITKKQEGLNKLQLSEGNIRKEITESFKEVRKIIPEFFGKQGAMLKANIELSNEFFKSQKDLQKTRYLDAWDIERRTELMKILNKVDDNMVKNMGERYRELIKTVREGFNIKWFADRTKELGEMNQKQFGEELNAINVIANAYRTFLRIKMKVGKFIGVTSAAFISAFSGTTPEEFTKELSGRYIKDIDRVLEKTTKEKEISEPIISDRAKFIKRTIGLKAGLEAERQEISGLGVGDVWGKRGGKFESESAKKAYEIREISSKIAQYSEVLAKYSKTRGIYEAKEILDEFMKASAERDKKAAEMWEKKLSEMVVVLAKMTGMKVELDGKQVGKMNAATIVKRSVAGD